MRHAGAGAVTAIISSASFLCTFVTRTFAQIPGATNEPPVGRDLPNHPMEIPFGLKVVIALLVFAALGTAFYFALRAWRASHLFRRQYRVPLPKNVELRLGASRSGGRMATINFAANLPPPSSPTHQKHEGTPLP